VNVRSIQLTYCRLDYGDTWASTHFPDGTSYGAEPHDTPEYRALAERCGYVKHRWTLAHAPDVNRYMIEHEFSHNFLAQEIWHSTSAVLWALAHGQRPPPAAILSEEAVCILFQTWLRAGIPVAATAPGVNWWELKRKAIEMLEGVA